MKRIILFGLVLACACTKETTHNFEADDLAVNWKSISNDGGSFKCQWTLVNQGDENLGDSDWALYYNQIAGVPDPGTLPAQVTVTQVSGTFYRITPNTGFELTAGDTLKFSYTAYGAAIKTSDAPSGLYMIIDDAEPQVLSHYTVEPFIDPQQINRSSQDFVPIPTTEKRYQLNENMSQVEVDELPDLIPTPSNLVMAPESYQLGEMLTISYTDGLEPVAQMLADKLGTSKRSVQIAANQQQADIMLSMQNSGYPEEGYNLICSNNGITVSGGSAAGTFYGTQTLLQILPPAFWEGTTTVELAGYKISDQPRFAYRGLHLDVSRNFHSVESVKKLMDLMAFYKLNKFHFHLTDDEGWRLAINGLDELTEIGARRGHTETEKDHLRPAYGSGPDVSASNNYGNGYYSRQEFIEILKYAHQRNIEVIPEINFPGHARAAIKAMEVREDRIADGSQSNQTSYLLSDPEDASVYTSVQGYDDNTICVCQESVYTFIEHVVTDLVQMYQEAQVPLTTVHTGGDEVPAGVWESSPVCDELLTQNPELSGPEDLPRYFLQRYHEILEQNNLVTAGWEEIAMHKVEQEVGGEDNPLDSRKVMVPNPEFVENNFLAYVWLSIWGQAGEDLAYKLANMGYKVVMSNASNLYFDFAYDKDPQETGLYWAGLVDTRKPFELTPLDIFKTGTLDIMGHPLSMDDYSDHTRLTDEGRKNILGIQGQLWSETVKGQDALEYYIFPKLLGLAERAWAPDPYWATAPKRSDRLSGLDFEWNRFANGIARKQMPMIDQIWGSVNYRVPPPGAKVMDGQLHANVSLPGLIIRYTLDGSEPTEESPEYTGPVQMEAPTQINLKAFTSSGKASRTSSLTLLSNQ